VKLTKLRLENFRCFEALDVQLHPQLTVLVAENGLGKSTLLDGVRVALWPFVSSFDLARNAFNDPGNAISIDDVRLVKLDTGDMARQLPSRVMMTGDFGVGNDRTWIRYRDKEAKLTKTKDDGDTSFMKQWATVVQSQIRNPDKPTLDLPVFGYYGTGRLWAQKKLTETTKGKDDTRETDFYVRTFAYMNCLDPASSFKHFKEWFIWAFESYWEAQIKFLEGKGTEAEVHAAQGPVLVVQQAIDTFLRPSTGWHTLEYSFSQEKSLVLHHDDQGTLKVDVLSDGIRSMLAMVGDIAYRCIKLNPHLGDRAAQETHGVVMIDEVDMHLHPCWQQIVLGQLQEAFPLVQFIVTTHSPQVLTTVKAECIRGLKFLNGKVVVKDDYQFSEGAEAQLVLEDILGVTSRAQKLDIVKQLNAYLELVGKDQWDIPEAIQLRTKLDEWSHGHETALLKADMDIRMRQFRRSKGGA
jgi:predicted ATP-binding protein involved in virulence